MQNDRVVQVCVGDAALVASVRPGTHVSEERCGQWLSLQLPRQSLALHLGFDAQGGVLGRGETAAGRMLFDLVRDADIGDGSTSAPADFYMQLAVLDLIGALSAPSDPLPGSLHADKLFTGICGAVRDRVAEPEFGPCEVAAETGISLRYLQKCFTERGTT